jgi:hypothetical protein
MENKTLLEFNDNKSIFNEMNSTEITTFCLKLVLSTHQSRDYHKCINHLKGFNQTLLIQMIRSLGNYSLSRPNLEIPSSIEWHILLIWSLIFGPMVLFAIIGNLLIIWIISRQKIMRTVINIFLLNLTISDLLTITFNATFNFVFMLTGNWPFGSFYCVANNFITNLTIASSVFTIIVTSVDRYVFYYLFKVCLFSIYDL